MRPSSRVLAIVASLGVGAVAAHAGCGGTVVEQAGGDAGIASDAGAGADAACEAASCATDAGTSLRWYATCGDPVCRDPADAGAADAATCDAAGAPCTQRGLTCGDGAASCGVILVCEDHDPRTGGCPISTAKLKDGIAYVAEPDLARLHDETLALRLATYAYRPAAGDPGVRHLGFLVEDANESYAVDRGHDRVDLYGYMSMIVATMQVQEREIQELRSELRQARGSCSAAAFSEDEGRAVRHFTPLR
jgi:hypothetical protein